MDFLTPNLSFTITASILFGFFAVLFLQSGSDKVFDWKGNLAWLTGHFQHSPLAGKVPFLLGLLTMMELMAGFGSAVSTLAVWFCGALPCQDLFFLQMAFNAFTLLALFGGQRMAKDYAGAAGIVPYFLVALVGMVLWSGIFAPFIG
jgi:hypothetical protein